MKIVVCDNCSSEINNEDYIELTISNCHDGSYDTEDTYEFCSNKCLGIWLLSKSKELGVYE